MTDATETFLNLFENGTALGGRVAVASVDGATMEEMISRGLVSRNQFGLSRTWRGAEYLAERFRQRRQEA